MKKLKKTKQKEVKKDIAPKEKEIEADVYCDVCKGALKEVGTNLFSIDGECSHYPKLEV